MTYKQIAQILVDRHIVDEWKNKVKERAKGRCEKCGQQRPLFLHHIRSGRLYPHLYFRESNVQILCHECHPDRYGNIDARSRHLSARLRKLLKLPVNDWYTD